MDNDIYVLHRNGFGIAFMWKKPSRILDEKIQIIFRDMGFYLTCDEVRCFYKYIEETRLKLVRCANGCALNCRFLLLRTPSRKIDIAINPKELEDIDDLIKGILFRIELEKYIEDVAKN